jgi:hypothetical protein
VIAVLAFVSFTTALVIAVGFGRASAHADRDLARDLSDLSVAAQTRLPSGGAEGQAVEVGDAEDAELAELD